MDISLLMKQAQDFQQKMGQVQEELAKKTVTSEVGGGMVKVTVNGKQELLAIQIEKEVINGSHQSGRCRHAAGSYCRCGQ